jgi:hypothetical protein
MQQRSKLATKRKRNPQSNDQRLTAYYSNTLRTPLFPPETFATVGYSAWVHLSGSPYQAYPLYTNAPYDVDPALGSTSTQGLLELSAMYHAMRPMSYTSTLEFINQHTTATEFTVLHTNLINGVTIGGGAVDLTLLDMNPMAQHVTLGHAYGPARAVLTASHTICEVVGSKAPLTDSTYSSSTVTNPSDHTYLLIGAKTPVGNVDAWVRVRLQMHVKFYDRKMLSA